MSRLLIAAAGLGIATAACAPRQPPTPSSPGTHSVVVFSDLHFNPFSDSTLVDSLQNADVSRWRTILAGSGAKAFSTYGKDTNYPLMASALAAMGRAAPDARVVLFAGDFMAHGFQASFKRTARDTSAAALAAFTARTLQFLAQEIGAAFPRAQIVPALGNNDSGCGDYQSQPGSAFLRSFAEAWAPVINRGGAAPDFLATFPVAGHYTARAPALRARVVVINDVYWSPKYANACGAAGANPGRDALNWLDGVLIESRSRGESVWVLTHAPVGIDVFATIRADTAVSMLAPAYAADLISGLQRFSSTVRYGIYGHTHMTEFRVMSDTDRKPLLGTQGFPAISPLFGNNPGFAVLAVDAETGGVADYTMYTLTNLTATGTGAGANWSREYSLRDAYGVQGISAGALAALEAKLAADTVARANFIRFYDSGSGRAGPSAANWRAYWCGLGSLDPAGFMSCYRGR